MSCSTYTKGDEQLCAGWTHTDSPAPGLQANHRPFGAHVAMKPGKFWPHASTQRLCAILNAAAGRTFAIDHWYYVKK